MLLLMTAKSNNNSTSHRHANLDETILEQQQSATHTQNYGGMLLYKFCKSSAITVSDAHTTLSDCPGPASSIHRLESSIALAFFHARHQALNAGACLLGITWSSKGDRPPPLCIT